MALQAEFSDGKKKLFGKYELIAVSKSLAARRAKYWAGVQRDIFKNISLEKYTIETESGVVAGEKETFSIIGGEWDLHPPATIGRRIEAQNDTLRLTGIAMKTSQTA
jgi:hypothetical protein